MRRPILPFAGMLLLATACSPDAGGDADPARGAWEPGEEWRLVPEATIGSPDGEGPAAFSRIVDVAVDPLGRVWVADGQQQEIRVFERDGRHVRTLGGKGAGPEEFAALGGMDWGPDGHLWVMDGGNSRFAVWDTAGTLVATHRRNASRTSVPWTLGFDRQGLLYDEDAPGRPDDERRFIVRFGPGLQPRDTFTIPAFELPVFAVEQRQGLDTRISQIVVPFAATQEWRLDPQGFVWIGMTDRYRLERHAFGGGVTGTVERKVEPRRVTPQERERAVGHLRAFERQMGAKVDVSRIPQMHSVFEDFFFGDEGTLWVRVATGPREPGRLDVFDAKGTYLGQVTAPTRLLTIPAPAFRGGYVVGVVQDEDHVESVVVMRLEKPAGRA